LVLIDIDGVLNAFRFRRSNDNQLVYKQKRVNGYQITYRTEWVEWVEAIVAAADTIWATMWQEDALFHFAPKTKIGRGIELYIDFHAHYQEASSLRTGRSVGEYKHPGVLATVGDRPFIWIDDDISERQHAWALERAALGIPTLLIQPDPAVGITEEHVAQVHEFLAGVTIAA
jgi:hypothetical protein